MNYPLHYNPANGSLPRHPHQQGGLATRVWRRLRTTLRYNDATSQAVWTTTTQTPKRRKSPSTNIDTVFCMCRYERLIKVRHCAVLPRAQCSLNVIVFAKVSTVKKWSGETNQLNWFLNFFLSCNSFTRGCDLWTKKSWLFVKTVFVAIISVIRSVFG